MNKVLNSYLKTNLILRILIGLIVGCSFGMLIPGVKWIGVLGNVFVGCLKSIAPLLVFVLIISSIANSAGSIGKRFRTVIILYLATTLIASILAVFASYIFPVTLKFAGEIPDAVPPSGLSEVVNTLVSNLISNPISSIADANYLGVLFWAVIIGLAIKLVSGNTTKEVLKNISDAITNVVRWIIEFAPFGILGLSFDLVSQNGLSIFYDYGKLLALLVGCMLATSLIINPLIVACCLKKNPYPLVFKCLKESGITAFFTRSSAANIPVNMELCRKLNLDKDLYSVSIPLGATINMDGAAITIAIMSLAAANTLGISVPFYIAVILCVVATIGACGASGVAGGSLLIIPVACSLFGISNDIAMQVVGIGFIIGVVQDSLETALNSSGDVVFAATAEYMERQKKGEIIDFKKEFNK